MLFCYLFNSSCKLMETIFTKSQSCFLGRREGSAGMDMWNGPMVQSRQPFTYRLRESVGLGGPRWHGSSWQRGIADSGSSRLSTLMIEICGDLVWDVPCLQQASYLEGGPLMWMLPMFLHVNQKSDYDDGKNKKNVSKCCVLKIFSQSAKCWVLLVHYKLHFKNISKVCQTLSN